MKNERCLIHPIILAGGKGSRFWPLAREHYPKQLLNLFNDCSLLQTTLKFIETLSNMATPMIVANEAYRFIIAEQTRQITQHATILIELTTHDTALAVALAAFYSTTQKEDPLLLVLPSDFYIPDSTEFSCLLQQAIETAMRGKLVIFGLEPVSADTGYGYIKKGQPLADCDGYCVDDFIEKPPINDAQDYVKSGNYYWNSGLFLFQASTILKTLEQHAPMIFLAAQKLMSHVIVDPDFIRFSEVGLTDCPYISIDKAVFEKTNDAVVFPFKGGWHDIGNWKALYELSEKDAQGNVLNGNVIPFNSTNCYFYSTGPLMVASNLTDCLVVATEDAILATRLDEQQPMKEVVSYLKNNKKDSHV